MSFTKRIFLALLGVSLITGLASSYFIYETVQEHLRTEYLTNYRQRVQLLAELSRELRAAEFDEITRLLHRMIDSDPDLDRIEIFSSQGKSLERINTTGIADASDATPEILKADQEVWLPGKLVISKSLEGYRFVASISTQGLQASLKSFQLKFISVVIAITALALALAWWITAVLSRKVGRIRSSIEEIARDHEGAREVPVQRNAAGRPKDELDLLAAEFNGMVLAVRESQEKVLEARKVEAQAVVAAQVAHDIRSPLTSMGIALNQLQQGASSDALSTMKHGIDRVAGILKKLSATYGKKSDSLADGVEIPRLTLIDSVIKNVLIEHEAKKLIVEGFGAIPSIWSVVQVSEIQSAVSNILNNAGEAISPEAGRIRVSLKQEGAQVLLSIEDNGVGIAPENLEKIFERKFTQGKAQGTGLGLFQAKSAVEWSGGKISVRSQPGQGSCFTLTLPTERKPDWITSTLKLAPGEKIVFVDDDPSVLSLWKSRFESELGSRASYFKSLASLSESIPVRPWPSDAILVIDQFLGPESSGTRGLDFLIERGLKNHGYLCTSEFDDPEIQARIRKAGLRLIPKPWIGGVKCEY